MDSRTKIFERITNAVGDQTPDPTELEALYRDIPPLETSADVECFLQRARETGAQAERFAHPTELRAWLRNYVQETGQTSILYADEDLLEHAFGLDSRDLPMDWQVHRVDAHSKASREETKMSTAATHIGIGMARAGFVDSGAICVTVSPRESRALSLLVDTHIALLPASAIRSSLADWAAELSAVLADKEVRTTLLIAGPSKTADIEKVLVTGIHGPGAFIICVLDDDRVPDTKGSGENESISFSQNMRTR